MLPATDEEVGVLIFAIRSRKCAQTVLICAMGQRFYDLFRRTLQMIGALGRKLQCMVKAFRYKMSL